MNSILWRRLDVPGHDACRLLASGAGWKLEGTATFREYGAVARLDYSLMCDRSWHAQRGHVSGWFGERVIELVVTRSEGGAWAVNGVAVPGLERYVDLDFGFTPATNLPQLRRIDLTEGEAADVPVAWLDVSSTALTVLAQRYERRSEQTYWYQSPSAGYEGLLEVDSAGFIRRYPDLWEAEP
jgi:hypothetical protein